ncbi:MAG: helix-turn-helix domain-containing protein [Haloarculaceae archaeon]
MAIVVEFTLPAASFPFGRSVSGGSGVKVWLERLVPLASKRVPFLWASSDGGFEAFEQTLRESDIVTDVEAVASVENSVLYQVVWDEAGEAFLNGLADAGGTIMEANGNATWSFTVRFNNHADLTKFHQFYQDEEYPVHIEQVSVLEDEPGQHYGWALTQSQRRAVLLALENGYFSVPRETKLEEIADELGITRQAASELFRRGTETVLRKALVGFSAADFDAGTDDEE